MLLKMSLPGAVVCIDNMALEVWLLRIFRDLSMSLVQDTLLNRQGMMIA
jgi:hypothetical protein